MNAILGCRIEWTLPTQMDTEPGGHAIRIACYIYSGHSDKLASTQIHIDFNNSHYYET